ncbi:MAG: hypothetical protein JWN11_2031 [Hyphomicrobiales bacterium]|nr:hypothetical protein [Hyphomicrobiales bacterium]
MEDELEPHVDTPERHDGLEKALLSAIAGHVIPANMYFSRHAVEVQLKNAGYANAAINAAFERLIARGWLVEQPEPRTYVTDAGFKHLQRGP